MVNQQGYHDAAQFMFGPDGGYDSVQMMAMASCILVFTLNEEKVTT